MQQNMLIELIVAVVALILSVQFYRKKWLFLIAGYNTMKKERKAQYNTSRLSKCLSIFMLLLSLFHFYSLLLPGKTPMMMVYLIVLVGIVLLVVVNSPFVKAKRD